MTKTTPVQAGSIRIDGREYRLADLSEAARTQLAQLQACDQEALRLQLQLSIAQTARGVYAAALKASLEGLDSATH